MSNSKIDLGIKLIKNMNKPTLQMTQSFSRKNFEEYSKTNTLNNSTHLFNTDTPNINLYEELYSIDDTYYLKIDDTKTYTLYNQGKGLEISGISNLKPSIYDIDKQYNSDEWNIICQKIVTYCENNGLSNENLVLLEKLLKDMTFKTALNDFSIGNGCGAYSLLTVLNGYYSKNIEPLDFFTITFIENLHDPDEDINEGFLNWLNLIVGKIPKNIKDERNKDILNNRYDFCLKYDLDFNNIDRIRGPLTATGMEKILNNLGLLNEKILGYTSSEIHDSFLEDKIKNHLSEGKPIIIMVKSGGNLAEFLKNTDNIFVENNSSDYADFLKENECYDALTNSHHFLTLIGIDDNDNILIADSRYLPNDDNGNSYNHVISCNYDTLEKYIDKSIPKKESILYGSEKAGMIFID